jgi:hypothetical protein
VPTSGFVAREFWPFADPNASVTHYGPCRACYNVTKAVIFAIVRYETKVQSRTIDPDGTANIFVVIDSQVTDPDFQTMSTEPDLDIRRVQPHLRDGKVYGLSIHLRTWPDLMEGSPLTISFGE